MTACAVHRSDTHMCGHVIRHSECEWRLRSVDNVSGHLFGRTGERPNVAAMGSAEVTRPNPCLYLWLLTEGMIIRGKRRRECAVGDPSWSPCVLSLNRLLPLFFRG